MRNNQAGSAHVFLAIGVLIVLVGAVGWLAWQNFTKQPVASQQVSTQKTPKPSVEAKKITEPDDPTANTWSTLSSNWSGYVAEGTTFTEASGRIKVPRVTCTEKEGSVAFWTGFDGFNTQTVEQAGVTVTCENASYYAKNKPVDGATYYAWSLMYGAGGMKVFDIALSPGDVVFYKVAYANGKYSMSVTNETTGKTDTDTQACVVAEATREVSGTTDCPRTQVEWIVERPGGNKFANFGNATLYDNTATPQDGKTGYASAFSNRHINMSQSGKLLDTVSSLRSKGTFDANWVASGVIGN